MQIWFFSNNVFLQHGLKHLLSRDSLRMMSYEDYAGLKLIVESPSFLKSPELIIHDFTQPESLIRGTMHLRFLSDNVTCKQVVLSEGMSGFFNRIDEHVLGLKTLDMRTSLTELQSQLNILKSNTGVINSRIKTKKYFLGMTKREEEILENILQGKSMKTIAMELDIDFRTVSIHKANVLKKFNINPKTEFNKFINCFSELYKRQPKNCADKLES